MFVILYKIQGDCNNELYFYFNLLHHPLLAPPVEVESHQPLPAGVHLYGDDGDLVLVPGVASNWWVEGR